MSKDRKKAKTMTITLKFKSIITAEETYPLSFELNFKKTLKIENYDTEDELINIIFNSAHTFEKTITSNLHVLDIITECKGIQFIHYAKTSQLLDLERIGIKII